MQSTSSEQEPARRHRAIARLNGELRLPDAADAYLAPLAMSLVAWADGALASEEGALIRKAVAAGADARVLDGWLAGPPGPSFRHRVLHLLALLRIDGRLDDASATSILESALAVAKAAGGVLGLGSISHEERSVLEALDVALAATAESIAHGAPERPTIPIVPEWLTSATRPRKSVHVHRGHHAIVQVIAIRLERCRTPDRPWEPSIVSFEPLEEATDLDVSQVRSALLATTHLPPSDRWCVLRELVSRAARPIDAVFRAELIAEARAASVFEGDCVLVGLGELSAIEDCLARELGWVAWHPGKIDELRIDGEFVRRLVAPGTFSAATNTVTMRRLPDVHHDDVPGLTVERLVLETGGSAPLTLASPAIPIDPTTRAVEWIAHFLPILRDPYATLLLDVPARGAASWSVDMRSAPLDVHTDRTETLPPGRALVVPPWMFARVESAFATKNRGDQ